MVSYAEKYKGIHPGLILERELKKKSLKQRPFALSINEHPQTINAIVKGRRDLPIAMALKIEEELGLEEGSLAMLQTFYDIQREKKGKPSQTPDFSILRKSLFWDTDIDNLNWDRHYKAVIRRVFERGNKAEQKELIRFYGVDKVTSVIRSLNRIEKY
nr:helix-turn-helix domain-containing protein [uncultured Allomuricauda sp.]